MTHGVTGLEALARLGWLFSQLADVGSNWQ